VRGCACVAAIAAARRGCALLAGGIGREEAGAGGGSGTWNGGDRRDLGFSDRRIAVVPGAGLYLHAQARAPSLQSVAALEWWGE